MAGFLYRLLLKALLPLGLVLGGLAYFAYLQGQNPLAMLRKSVESGSMPSLQELQSVLEGIAGEAAVGTEPRSLYRWEDADGAVFYGQSPPADARAVKVLRVDPQVNVIPAHRDPAPRPEEVEGGGAAVAAAGEVDESAAPKPYSPAQIEHLFDDARGLRETLQQRQQARDELFGGG